ncbi:MAG: 3-deoxy-manno-octulosonate cytidylyltransferase [Candidatus Omnitrophica bacterium]|nr:3-deoxy-manno-octulosonate cytidylyltransferase [Candidatus Omnitrophota bacterium]
MSGQPAGASCPKGFGSGRPGSGCRYGGRCAGNRPTGRDLESCCGKRPAPPEPTELEKSNVDSRNVDYHSFLHYPNEPQWFWLVLEYLYATTCHDQKTGARAPETDGRHPGPGDRRFDPGRVHLGRRGSNLPGSACAGCLHGAGVGHAGRCGERGRQCAGAGRRSSIDRRGGAGRGRHPLAAGAAGARDPRRDGLCRPPPADYGQNPRHRPASADGSHRPGTDGPRFRRTAGSGDPGRSRDNPARGWSHYRGLRQGADPSRSFGAGGFAGQAAQESDHRGSERGTRRLLPRGDGPHAEPERGRAGRRFSDLRQGQLGKSGSENPAETSAGGPVGDARRRRNGPLFPRRQKAGQDSDDCAGSVRRFRRRGHCDCRFHAGARGGCYVSGGGGFGEHGRRGGRGKSGGGDVLGGGIDSAAVVGVIPARYASVRFPGKALARVSGKPLVQWVWERARESKRLERLIVATDDERILETVRKFGAEGVMTSPDLPSGTDRAWAVVRESAAAKLVVNIQGDEPLITPTMVDQLVEGLEKEPSAGMATMRYAMRTPVGYNDANVVKVVTDEQGWALYFSRSPIPHYRQKDCGSPLWYKHIGLYAYRRDLLEQFVAWPPSLLETAEKLEQLRALERGVRIRVLDSSVNTVGVDTLEDLRQVEKILGNA